MRAFWPIGEAAQADYEGLREVVVAGGGTLVLAAARFERRGLAGLIAWPATEPVFAASLVGARRPRWTPHTDPRLEALAAGYELILAAGGAIAIAKEAHR